MGIVCNVLLLREKRKEVNLRDREIFMPEGKDSIFDFVFGKDIGR